MNNKSLGQCTPTSCPKAGIKIHESNNDHTFNPFQSINNSQIPYNNQSRLSNPVNYHTTPLNNIDLDLDNYSLEDLYHLFNVHQGILNEDTLKNAKQIVLKMHPDKSKLDSKYFLFFSKAYKRLYSIYEFQNKSSSKKLNENDYFDESNKTVLDNMFEKNKAFKDPKNFNNWFNNAFEKNRLDNPIEQGYGDWLKSDDGFLSVNDNVTKTNMNEVFERHKKQIQSLTVYTGVTDMFASTLGGSLLSGSDNFTTEQYTDLRQAYTETLIPVTQDDYDKMQKFNTINEYKTHRDGVDMTPLSKEVAEQMLLKKQSTADQQSAALAYKYAQEAEKSKQKQQSFWSNIKQIGSL